MWGGSGAVGGELIGAALLLFVAFTLAVLGHATLVVPVRHDPRRCVRRRFVCWLGYAGFLIGGLYWVVTGREYVLGSPVGGLACGAVLGEVVGRFAWLRLKPADEEEGL